MKIYILCDMEGAAGVVDFHYQTYTDARYYDNARRLCSLEVNALIEGCLEAGATEILLRDGHGARGGGLDFDLLHPDVKVLMGKPQTAPWCMDDSFDALLLYGHHAMNKVSTGVLCHTLSSRTIHHCRLNGERIGEIGLNMCLAGYYGIPTIFISGDKAACEEAQQYVPNIECVATKEGLSRTSAISLTAAKAKHLLKTGGRRALSHRDAFRPFFIPPPYEYKVEALHEEAAEQAARCAGVERTGARTWRVTGDDFIRVLQTRMA